MSDPEYIEAQQRRKRSHALLAGQKLPIIDSLPCFAPMSAVRMRPIDDVVHRAASLACINHRAHLEYLADLDDFMKEEGLFHHLTPEEKKFYFSPPDPLSPMAGRYAWCIEGCHALFWALGYFDSLSYPDAPTESKRLYQLFFAGGLRGFRAGSRLRKSQSVLDAVDLYFRYYAICRHAWEQSKHPPGMLNTTIIHQRYAALLWLIGRGEWDEVQKSPSQPGVRS